MEDKTKTPEIENLEKELASGIASLKGLVGRKASDTMVTYQTKVIQGTLDDLLNAIYPKWLTKLEEDK